MLVVEPADKAPTTQPWLIDQLWPLAGVGIVGGPPKSKKTWFALALAASVATGSKFLDGWQATEGRVLYLAGEDAPGTLRTRLGDAAPFVDACHDQVRLDDPQGVQDLSDAVGQVGAKLLIVDPLVRFHRSGESLSAIVPVLAALRGIQRAHSCAVVVVHHMRKGGKGGQGLRGTGELHAWGDANCYLEPAGRVVVEQRTGPGFEFAVEVKEGVLKKKEKGPTIVIGRLGGWAPLTFCY